MEEEQDDSDGEDAREGVEQGVVWQAVVGDVRHSKDGACESHRKHEKCGTLGGRVEPYLWSAEGGKVLQVFVVLRGYSIKAHTIM